MSPKISCCRHKKNITPSLLQYVCQINNLCLTFTSCNPHKIKHFMTLYWLEEHLQHAASWLCSILFSALEHNIFGNVSRLKLPATQLFLAAM